jgi:hypothetical protein
MLVVVDQYGRHQVFKSTLPTLFLPHDATQAASDNLGGPLDVAHHVNFIMFNALRAV